MFLAIPAHFGSLGFSVPQFHFAGQEKIFRYFRSTSCVGDAGFFLQISKANPVIVLNAAVSDATCFPTFPLGRPSMKQLTHATNLLQHRQALKYRFLRPGIILDPK